MMPTAAVSMISFVLLTCPSLLSIQDLRLQRIAPIKSNQLSLHVKPAGKREQVPESLTQYIQMWHMKAIIPAQQIPALFHIQIARFWTPAGGV